MKLRIASPLESRKIEGLTGLYFTTVEGERGILRGHTAFVAGLKDGSLLRLVSPDGETRIRLGEGGFIRFRDDEAVLVTRSYHPAE